MPSYRMIYEFNMYTKYKNVENIVNFIFHTKKGLLLNKDSKNLQTIDEPLIYR